MADRARAVNATGGACRRARVPAKVHRAGSRPRGCRSSSTYIPHVPYVISQWRRQHPGPDIPDGYVFTRPRPAGSTAKDRDQVIYYHYKADGTRRDPGWHRRADRQGQESHRRKATVKRNRFV